MIKNVSNKAKSNWDRTTKEWKAANPPDFDNYWYCRVGGGALSDGSAEYGLQLNLCHDISRARDSTKTYVVSNISAGCPKHNREMGSRSFDEYLASNPDLRCGP